MDDDDPGAGYALFGDKGELSTSPHGDLRAYTFAGRTLQLHQCVPDTPPHLTPPTRMPSPGPLAAAAVGVTQATPARGDGINHGDRVDGPPTAASG